MPRKAFSPRCNVATSTTDVVAWTTSHTIHRVGNPNAIDASTDLHLQTTSQQHTEELRGIRRRAAHKVNIRGAKDGAIFVLGFSPSPKEGRSFRGTAKKSEHTGHSTRYYGIYLTGSF